MSSFSWNDNFLYLEDSSDDYHGVVGRFRGHSEAADEELAEYFIGWVSKLEGTSSTLWYRLNCIAKLVWHLLTSN